jgi:hypothetical protein
MLEKYFSSSNLSNRFIAKIFNSDVIAGILSVFFEKLI